MDGDKKITGWFIFMLVGKLIKLQLNNGYFSLILIPGLDAVGSPAGYTE